ncbi:protoporphyrinogen/coproporphyrinogen oxidase [Nocardioides antri]|uniref:FAD-dependent oxidoreductase n=1 Tax=Nocardioides antri TaxID=2607659 RepID=A0A5B1LZJ4_9ACTN|nr:FAD-dependent oxidoreductase [Nocardioides antri]KAA1425914.1 FAD-dependent oxidoreductase [Nocardioides antri]
MRRFIVVGGGISGLTAARDLADAGHDVLLLEATDRLGGKLRRGEVAGVTVDVGAEAMINRRPEAVALATAVGLPVTHPTAATSRVWTRGALRPLPRTLMGAPLDLDQLEASGILSPEGVTRARHQQVPHPDGDVSVGDLVAARYGDEVVDRLVEPLLGGVYAGQARAISARAAVPQLLDLLTRDQISVPDPPTAAAPVFAGVPGGMWQLPEAVAAALAGSGRVDVRRDVVVREVRRTPEGLAVVADQLGIVSVEAADGVVVATPAAPTARMLADLAPVAARELAGIDYASSALVTFAFRADPDVTAAIDVGASGFLVPPVDGRAVKAATFSFAKWEWVRAAGLDKLDHQTDLLLFRTSLGRHGEEQALQVPDDELVRASLEDLAAATGLTAAPVDAVVQRWGGGLPQYAVGHVERVARIRAAVAEVPGLAVCGAAYDGVGIAACVASGHRAAGEVAAAG